MIQVAKRLVALCLAVAGLVAIGVQLVWLYDIEQFEYRPLFELVGPSGISMVVVLNLGLLLLVVGAIAVFLKRRLPLPRLIAAITLACAIPGLWVAEWVLLESPITVRVANQLAESPAPEPDLVMDPDLAGFSLMDKMPNPVKRERLRIMYERIRVNSPRVYETHPLGATIDRYAARYDVDQTLLFFFLYVGSFWGEATSGPVPFLGSMTVETIRDVVQVHLPGRFIESRTRQALITSPVLQRLFGQQLGFKLRYALHKATLDVSTQPYDLNLYSDVFLVLREYPGEFPDVFEATNLDPVAEALRDSFVRLRRAGLVAPYEQPFARPAYDRVYYDRHRHDLRQFARAAFYMTSGNFDFATRAAALVLAFQRDYYRARLGSGAWDALPAWQQAAMLAMTRDLYVPNVGRLGYNLYALPELNCTPVEFVASSALADRELLSTRLVAVWRPQDYLALWGGAATKLRILSEVWEVTHGSPLPGLIPEDSIPAARRIIALKRRGAT